MDSKNTFLQLVRLSRAPNLLMIAFTQYLVGVFLIGPKEEWMSILGDVPFAMVVLSTVLIATAGYFINDYYDVKIDLINKPDRVVVGKVLRRRQVMILHVVLSTVGVFLGLFISLWVGLINGIAAFLLWFYSNDLKRRPFVGNFVVAFLTGLSLVLVSVYYEKNEMLVSIYALFAFGVTLIREIVKDMEDMKGDQAFGSRSLPISLGIRGSKLVVYTLVLCFVSTLVVFLAVEGNFILSNYFLLMVLPTCFILYRLYRADTQRHFHILSQQLKLITLTGVLSMIFVN